MLISPDTYCAIYLKDRTPEQILSHIRGLKSQIGHLKNVMEHPDYPNQPHSKPSENTLIWCHRLYLEISKKWLVASGGEYIPSKAEQDSLLFTKNIPAIKSVRFSIGGYCSGWITRTVRLDGEQLLFSVENELLPPPSDYSLEADFPCTKEKFLEELHNLYLGEWRKKYDTRRFGYEILDGTQWELEIEYNNGTKPFKVYGDNAYPYNFEGLRKLMGCLEGEDEE